MARLGVLFLLLSGFSSLPILKATDLREESQRVSTMFNSSKKEPFLQGKANKKQWVRAITSRVRHLKPIRQKIE